MAVLFRAAFLAGCASLAFAQTPPLIRILADELNRNFNVLRQKADPPAYYMAYEATETEASSANASLGALKSSRSDRARVVDITVRVGSPKLDNYHRIRGDFAQFTSAVALPLEDSEPAIRRILWAETDRIYRAAAERLIKIKTNLQVKVADEDDSADFSQEPAATYFEPFQRLNFPLDQAAARARRLSQQFVRFPSVVSSSVSILGGRETRSFVDTGGARIQQGRGWATIGIAARAKASDGMDLIDAENIDAEDFAGLPADAEVLKTLDRVASSTVSMLRAPVVEPYVGPAMLSGRAAAVLFHEIFGHRIEGHRQKDETEGQTFTKSVGSRILPDFMSVISDPERTTAAGKPLYGHYAYDDEGVKGQSVTVVDNGVLKTFLMSRSPVRGFAHSNGHGRRQPGFEVVSRQSNLFVQSTKQVTDAKLREMLIAEVRRQNKPYGLYFDEVTGGFTLTGRQAVQAFKVTPVIVYRVYADGRSDELVRGADIVGTPLASFAKILATGDRPQVFNGYCGAESGRVPVSAISPAILIGELEIEKKAKSDERPPLLPPPGGGGR